MIIGKNSFKPQQIDKRFTETSHNIQNNIKTTSNQMAAMQHSNVLSKDDMNDKSFAMLQERLRNGTITMEEFNKRCIQLGKQRKQ